MKSYRSVEEAVRDQHSPGDAERILALWEEDNRAEQEEMVETMTELVCCGTVVLSLDEDGRLLAEMPHLGN
jgi:hypothetical protein